MITPEQEAHILRLHHAEKWPPGTIAAQLGLHHSVITRVIDQEEVPRATITRSSKADPFVPFICATLKQYPRLTAARLYQMVWTGPEDADTRLTQSTTSGASGQQNRRARSALSFWG